MGHDGVRFTPPDLPRFDYTTDLITTADLRRGLLSLWLAEADTAGLDIDCWHPMGDGVNDAAALARFSQLRRGLTQ